MSMSYLIVFNWGWLAGAGALGFALGWISPISRTRHMSVASERWALAVFAGLIVVSLAHLLPGRVGYWLDLGLVMIAAYLAGCIVGAVLRYWLLLRPAA
jgi:hypothetical protein